MMNSERSRADTKHLSIAKLGTVLASQHSGININKYFDSNFIIPLEALW